MAASSTSQHGKAVRRLIQAMPKAELHLHLDGCLRPVTALELAAGHGIDASRTYYGIFDEMVAAEHPGSQAELLQSFALPISLMQTADALHRIAAELVEDKAADRVRYMEIKWAPAVHLEHGLTLDEVIWAVATGAREAGDRLGVVVTLTPVAMRSHDVHTNIAVAEAAVRNATLGVTGFDFAGFEEEFPDSLAHAEAFDIARDGGLGITIHTGELLDGGAGVREALALRPRRIAHGCSVIADPALIDELIERGITLDVCPTSNVQAATVATFADHPLPILLRRGLGVTINTDDTTISDITLSEEWMSCVTELGLTLPELWQCNLHALDVAFVDDHTKARLRAEFESWAAPVPELHA